MNFKWHFQHFLVENSAKTKFAKLTVYKENKLDAEIIVKKNDNLN